MFYTDRNNLRLALSESTRKLAVLSGECDELLASLKLCKTEADFDAVYGKFVDLKHRINLEKLANCALVNTLRTLALRPAS